MIALGQLYFPCCALQEALDALLNIVFLHDRISSHKLRLGLVT